MKEALNKHFGFDTFRPGQAEIIAAILAGQDVLAVLPTGGGKSIAYQLPALMLDGFTLVVSPLISLMKDQVDALRNSQLPAAFIHSGQSFEEYIAVMRNVQAGRIKLLYVAPERLFNPTFLQYLPLEKLHFIAVDEAHCVSQWGHDFRTSYRQLREFIHQLPHRPILAAFTATATSRVQADIIQQLELHEPKVVLNSFDRPNIQFIVEEPISKIQALYSHLTEDEAIIIYVNTRKGVDRVYEQLRKKGYQVVKYHAGMSDEEREESQNDFIYERVNLIVATNAFGMGIDKTDVRKVIHYTMPTDIESYYQEVGRAGRDGLAAKGILLYSNQDIITNKYIIQKSQDPNVKERLDRMIQYSNATSCLRCFLLNYFDEEVKVACNNCSACLRTFEVIDITRSAQMVVSCIVRMKHSFGMTMICDVLRGSRNQRLLEWKFNQLSTYGLLKDHTESYVKDVISRLLAEDYLQLNEHQALQPTKRAKSLLAGKETLTMKKKERSNYAYTYYSSKEEVSVGNEDLFEQLKALRTRLAKEEGVPAYIIFNNSTLAEMTRLLPKTQEDLLKVSGIGLIKAEKYGEAFLKVLHSEQ